MLLHGILDFPIGITEGVQASLRIIIPNGQVTRLKQQRQPIHVVDGEAFKHDLAGYQIV